MYINTYIYIHTYVNSNWYIFFLRLKKNELHLIFCLHWKQRRFLFFSHNHISVYVVPLCSWLSCLLLAHVVNKRRQGLLLLGLTSWTKKGDHPHSLGSRRKPEVRSPVLGSRREPKLWEPLTLGSRCEPKSGISSLGSRREPTRSGYRLIVVLHNQELLALCSHTVCSWSL